MVLDGAVGVFMNEVQREVSYGCVKSVTMCVPPAGIQSADTSGEI